MAENISISDSGDKKTKYEELLPQIEALVAGEKDLVANLANIAAALKYAMKFFWVGFYFRKDNELVLGPFQGPVACTRIAEGKGVCGTVMRTGEALVVPDVNLFPGHIACSAETRSEIVIPAKVNGKVVLVLDIDSEFVNYFDEFDKEYLLKIIRLIEDMVN